VCFGRSLVKLLLRPLRDVVFRFIEASAFVLRMMCSVYREQPVFGSSAPSREAVLNVRAQVNLKGGRHEVCGWGEEGTRAAQSNPWGGLGKGGEGQLDGIMIARTVSNDAKGVWLIQVWRGRKEIQTPACLMCGLLWVHKDVW
jgi:hypothetical protein